VKYPHLVTPKAAAKHDLLFNKPTSGIFDGEKVAQRNHKIFGYFLLKQNVHIFTFKKESESMVSCIFYGFKSGFM
jgi:hypothetical protein